VARPDERAAMPSVYHECWKRTMRTVLDLGAGIAHHHGIGRVRRDYLSGELGESGVALLRAIKRALDPENLLNPGALLRLRDGS
jgi:alkyldihydroxyacetonephosphate synthase